MKKVRRADGGMACAFVAQAETEGGGRTCLRKYEIIQPTPELAGKVKKIVRDVK
jgi:hypothetical protein